MENQVGDEKMKDGAATRTHNQGAQNHDAVLPDVRDQRTARPTDRPRRLGGRQNACLGDAGREASTHGLGELLDGPEGSPPLQVPPNRSGWACPSHCSDSRSVKAARISAFQPVPQISQYGMPYTPPASSMGQPSCSRTSISAARSSSVRMSSTTGQFR